MPSRVIAAVLLLSLTLGSCVTWRPVDISSDPLPSTVYVEMTSGERHRLRNAVVVRDSLRALAGITGSEVRVSVPMSEIASLEKRAPDWLAFSLGVAVFIGIPVAVMHTEGFIG